MKLSEHFDLSEFASRDGAPFTPEAVTHLAKVAAMLEILRAKVGTPLVILSGYRSPAWNAKVGGAPDSLHMRGMAADVASKTLSPAAIQAAAQNLQEESVVGGLGIYPGFTHVDIGSKRTWTPETKGY